MKHFAYLLIPGVLVLAVEPAHSGLLRRSVRRGHSSCQPSCCQTHYQAPCVRYENVERTVMVPTWVNQTRTVSVTRYRPEQRERTCVVHERVPVTRQVSRKYCVRVPERRTRTVEYVECRLEFREQTRNYTVCVPERVQRQGTRHICRMVPVTETRMVCEDQGHWQQVAYPVDCCGGDNGHGRRGGLFRRVGHRGGCDDCGGNDCCGECGQVAYRNVWVPNIVRRPVEVTCLRPRMTEVPYEYTQTVLKRETRSRTVRVPHYVPERRTREVNYTVYVPQMRTKTFNVTSCKIVPREHTQTYTQMVPYQDQREIQVRVCRMVPKTVVCRVRVWECCE